VRQAVGPQKWLDICNSERFHQTDCNMKSVICCRDVDAGIDNSSEWLTSDNVDTSSDLLLAQMLQFELDAEHDLQLKREEDKFNGSSKG